MGKAERDALATETDALSADVLRHARDDGTESRVFGTVTLAIDAARKAVSDARLRVASGGEGRRTKARAAP